MSKNVLIVEDEGIVSLELQEQLESLGHRVIGIADTGEQAIELANSTHPDLVLMDIRLKSAMDGAEAATVIRKSWDVPIVFLTAYSGDEVLQRVLRSEPYAYLVKPVQEQQLNSALRVVWHKHRQDAIRNQNTRRFSSIVRALPHGIILTDGSLTVRYLNSRGKQLFGVAGTREVWGRSIFEIISVEEETFAAALRTAVPKVLNNQRSILLGEFSLGGTSDHNKRYTIEVSAFADSGTEAHGVLVIFSEYGSENTTDRPADTLLWGNEETIDYSTAIDRLGELRSYLELEIIRLSLEDQPGDAREQGVYAGRLETNKRVLELSFGADALREIEHTVGQ